MNNSKRIMNKIVQILCAVCFLMSFSWQVKAAVSYHAYGDGVIQGTVRYVSQSTATAADNGWGIYSDKASGECGYASQSMAFSYIGKDVSPEYLCKGEYADGRWNTAYTNTYGVAGVSSVSGSGKPSGSEAVNRIDTMLNSFLSDGGKGQYSPVIIHYSKGGKSPMHAVIIVGRSEDGTYQTLDPARGMNLVELTLSSSGSVGGKITYADKGCSLDAVQQYYNPVPKSSGTEGESNSDSASSRNAAGTDAESKDAANKTNAGSKSKMVTGIELTGISHKIAAGKKLKLSATVLPKNASDKSLIWSSSNKKIATVSKTGAVTLNKNSGGKTVVITAKARDGSGKKARYQIKSMKGIVKKITVKGVANSLKAGKTRKLKVTVKARSGANRTLKWTSSNSKYASVSNNGKVTAHRAGKGKTVKITAKATDGSNVKKTVKLRIK